LRDLAIACASMIARRWHAFPTITIQVGTHAITAADPVRGRPSRTLEQDHRCGL